MTTIANERLLFIHIPKTGGTWVAEAMEAAGVKAEPLGEDPHPMLRDIPREGRFTFAFVREPVSWYRSVWNFHRRNPQADWPHLNRWIDLDLPDFLLHIAEAWPDGYLPNLYRQFVGKPDDPIDFIGHRERLRDDLVQALNLAGQDFDEATLRAFPARNFDNEEKLHGTLDPPPPVPVVPDAVRARITQSERKVYERFYSKSLV